MVAIAREIERLEDALEQLEETLDVVLIVGGD